MFSKIRLQIKIITQITLNQSHSNYILLGFICVAQEELNIKKETKNLLNMMEKYHVSKSSFNQDDFEYFCVSFVKEVDGNELLFSKGQIDDLLTKTKVLSSTEGKLIVFYKEFQKLYNSQASNFQSGVSSINLEDLSIDYKRELPKLVDSNIAKESIHIDLDNYKALLYD